MSKLWACVSEMIKWADYCLTAFGSFQWLKCWWHSELYCGVSGSCYSVTSQWDSTTLTPVGIIVNICVIFAFNSPFWHTECWLEDVGTTPSLPPSIRARQPGRVGKRGHGQCLQCFEAQLIVWFSNWEYCSYAIHSHCDHSVVDF